MAALLSGPLPDAGVGACMRRHVRKEHAPPCMLKGRACRPAGPPSCFPLIMLHVSSGLELDLGVGQEGEGARLGEQLLVEDAAEGEHGEAAVLDLLELRAAANG